jgi:hypothetical protein
MRSFNKYKHKHKSSCYVLCDCDTKYGDKLCESEYQKRLVNEYNIIKEQKDIVKKRYEKRLNELNNKLYDFAKEMKLFD